MSPARVATNQRVAVTARFWFYDPDRTLTHLRGELVLPDGARRPLPAQTLSLRKRRAGLAEVSFELVSEQPGRHQLEIWANAGAGRSSNRVVAPLQVVPAK